MENSSKLQHLGCNGGWQCIQLKLRQASLFADLTGMGCSSFAPLVLAVDFGVQAEDLACKQNHRTGEGKQARRHAWIETKPNQDRYQHLRAQPDGTSVLGGLNLGPFGSFPNGALPGQSVASAVRTGLGPDCGGPPRRVGISNSSKSA